MICSLQSGGKTLYCYRILLATAYGILLLTVQTMQIMAEESTENVDLSNPAVVVSSLVELQNAVENANDGDVMGIASVITEGDTLMIMTEA